jgi:hypothetical protein
VSSLNATLSLEGFIDQPEFGVDVKVLNVETGALDIIGQAESEDSVIETTSDDVKLYHWRGDSSALSSADWGLSDDGTKAVARIQAVLEDGRQLGTSENALQCYYNNDRSGGAFWRECLADESPFARVYAPFQPTTNVVTVAQLGGGQRRISSNFTMMNPRILRHEIYRQVGTTLTRIANVSNPCPSVAAGKTCTLAPVTDTTSPAYANVRYFARLVLPNNKLGFSKPVDFAPVPPPTVPSNFGLGNGPGRIAVGWQAALNTDHYEVFLNGFKVRETTDTLWVFNTVTAGQNHCFRVDAVGPFDRASTAEQCVIGKPAFPSPVSIGVSALPPGQQQCTQESLVNVTLSVLVPYGATPHFPFTDFGNTSRCTRSAFTSLEAGMWSASASVGNTTATCPTFEAPGDGRAITIAVTQGFCTIL